MQILDSPRHDGGQLHSDSASNHVLTSATEASSCEWVSNDGQHLSVAVIVPFHNATKYWNEFSAGLAMQTPAVPCVLAVDSSSSDRTADLARAAGYRVVSIESSQFNHGGTRQWALTLLPNTDIVVFLTQDAILSDPQSISKLLAPFSDPSVGATYGRQMARRGAGPIETHARQFNYPERSVIRTLSLRKTAGFRAAFASNSYAAYRLTALKQVGGFPSDTIVSEETFVFAKMLLAGWKTVYVAEAKVEHSHAYTLTEEFRRYFDIGVAHSQQTWLLEQFGRVGGEGQRFVWSEWKYLFASNKLKIVVAIFRSALKLIGYQMGLRHRLLSTSLCRRLSQQKSYWTEHRDALVHSATLPTQNT